MFESDKTPLINTSNTIIKESSDMPAYNNDTKNDIADYDVTVTVTENADRSNSMIRAILNADPELATNSGYKETKKTKWYCFLHARATGTRERRKTCYLGFP